MKRPPLWVVAQIVALLISLWTRSPWAFAAIWLLFTLNIAIVWRNRRRRGRL